MNRIEARYNSKYNTQRYNNNKHTKSSLYIPKKEEDIVFSTPLYLKIPYYGDDEEFFIITVTNPSHITKYKTYVYDASIEHFNKKDIITIGTQKGNYNNIFGGAGGGGSRIQYPTMWTIKFTHPELVHDVENIKSISHKILKKHTNEMIDEIEYTKILLTMDKIID